VSDDSVFSGVLIGIVQDRDDPQGEGRIQVTFPIFGDSLQTFWAPIAYPMAGKGRGFRFSPEIGDECLVAFDRSDPEHPYIVGFLHNGVDKPPTDDPKQRTIESVNGHKLVFEDPDVAQGNKGRLLITDAHGTTVEFANGHLRITAVGQLDVDAAVLTLNGRPVIRGGGAI
jgi:uncharacterized protein involved in type VI secretion and phage assembly